MCLSVARSRSFNLGVCRGGGCHGVDITGQYSSENWLEFGVVKSTGKQGRRKKKKKGKKRKEQKWIPQGSQTPSPGMLQSAGAARYNPFANADPLLPR